jgi:lysophospholipase L1-like esterase
MRISSEARVIRRRVRWAVALVGSLLPGCSGGEGSEPAQGPATGRARFLALGDSYTIGEGVGADRRWPVQLAARLRERGVSTSDPQIIARTGWTTEDLARALRLTPPRGPFELVTLLIGVNDQYRGLGVESYRPRFKALLGQAIAFAGDRPGRVLVLSIPDWGVTPYADGRDRRAIAAEIDRFNAVNREEAERAGVRYVDVTPASRKAAEDRSLIAGDGLHPSGALYGAWVRLALPEALAALQDQDRRRRAGRDE